MAATSSIGKLALQERTRRQILHKGDLIAPLPDVVVRVLALLNKGEIEPDELEQYLRYDQVLVAKMLGLVNSPFYGLSHTIKTVRDAIMVLGFRGLRSLILASSTAEYLKRDYACYGHGDKGLFKHSIAVASAARVIARATGHGAEEREELFVAGLLHDIGKMLVGPYLAERGVELAPGDCIVELEQRTIGIDHTEAGALVAAKWNLSAMVQELLKNHHAVADETPDELATPLAVLRLADGVAHMRGVGLDAAHAASAYSPERDLERLQIDGGEWQHLLPVIDDAIDQALASIDHL